MNHKTGTKKILFVTFNLRGGGAERVMVNLINSLSNKGHNIRLLLLEDKEGSYLDDIECPLEIICLRKRSRYDVLRLLFNIRRVIKDYKPDVVISFLHYANILNIIASFILKKNYKLIISERNYTRKYLPLERFSLLKKWLLMFTYPRADMIVAVSESIKSALSEYIKVPLEKIKTIYNPLAIENIKNKCQEDLYHPFFTKQGGHVIISVGRLSQQKRFDRLLRAFSILRKKIDNIYLIILGEGGLRKDLEDLAVRLNIDEVVDFPGFKKNPYAWITKSDIFVLSSDYEGFPNSLIEAMACGTAVISTDCPSGPDEIITNGKDGILVPVEDEGMLADAMYNLLTDERLRKKLSDEARKRAEDFRADKKAVEYGKLF
jgi:glycosyltransferase involved in cell wall biosynthesis